MKKYVLFATALIALASCTNDDFVGDKTKGDAAGFAPISFAFDVPTATRAESTGATAAAKLSNQFVVYAEKNENGAAAPTDGNLVIQNYQVKWTAGSENSTTSNTEGWEYVGFASDFPSQVTPVSTETQTIKYWDYSASTYTFTAISAYPADLTGGKMTIAKTTTGTAPASKYGKGYVVTISDATADLSKLYFADRVEIASTTAGTDRYADNAYGGNVTFRFRNAMSQVRVGMYETIPGYAISEVKFYENDGTTEQENSTPAKAFGAILPNTPATGFTGTLTVTYADNTTGIENQPIVTSARTGGTTEANLVLGTNIQTLDATAATPKFLGTTPTAPTWDTDGGTYTSVFPQSANTTNMVLKVDYTLYNTTTKETIEVKGATATVPAKYVAWKPNIKYTYLFKISNDTNGSSGQGVVGLYPITFDAVVVEAEDGQAEYITTVSEPSITTFGVKSNKYVYGGSDYEAGSDIYVTFLEGSTVKTPTLGGTGAQHVNVYAVSTTDASYLVTEASVAEAIANPASITNPVYTFDGTSTYTLVTDPANLAAGTTYYKTDGNSVAPGGTGYVQTVAVAGVDYQVAPKITATNINADATTYFTAAPAAVTEVPGEDGNDITIDALKLTGVKAVSGKYIAIEYEASTAWTGSYKKVYKVIQVQ